MNLSTTGVESLSDGQQSLSDPSVAFATTRTLVKPANGEFSVLGAFRSVELIAHKSSSDIMGVHEHVQGVRDRRAHLKKAFLESLELSGVTRKRRHSEDDDNESMSNRPRTSDGLLTFGNTTDAASPRRDTLPSEQPASQPTMPSVSTAGMDPASFVTWRLTFWHNQRPDERELEMLLEDSVASPLVSFNKYGHESWTCVVSSNWGVHDAAVALGKRGQRITVELLHDQTIQQAVALGPGVLPPSGAAGEMPFVDVRDGAAISAAGADTPEQPFDDGEDEIAASVADDDHSDRDDGTDLDEVDEGRPIPISNADVQVDTWVRYLTGVPQAGASELDVSDFMSDRNACGFHSSLQELPLWDVCTCHRIREPCWVDSAPNDDYVDTFLAPDESMFPNHIGRSYRGAAPPSAYARSDFVFVGPSLDNGNQIAVNSHSQYILCPLNPDYYTQNVDEFASLCQRLLPLGRHRHIAGFFGFVWEECKPTFLITQHLTYTLADAVRSGSPWLDQVSALFGAASGLARSHKSNHVHGAIHADAVVQGESGDWLISNMWKCLLDAHTGIEVGGMSTEWSFTGDQAAFGELVCKIVAGVSADNAALEAACEERLRRVARGCLSRDPRWTFPRARRALHAVWSRLAAL